MNLKKRFMQWIGSKESYSSEIFENSPDFISELAELNALENIEVSATEIEQTCSYDNFTPIERNYVINLVIPPGFKKKEGERLTLTVSFDRHALYIQKEKVKKYGIFEFVENGVVRELECDVTIAQVSMQGMIISNALLSGFEAVQFLEASEIEGPVNYQSGTAFSKTDYIVENEKLCYCCDGCQEDIGNDITYNITFGQVEVVDTAGQVYNFDDIDIRTSLEGDTILVIAELPSDNIFFDGKGTYSMVVPCTVTTEVIIVDPS